MITIMSLMTCGAPLAEPEVRRRIGAAANQLAESG